MLFLLSKMCQSHREDWNHCIKVVGMASLWTSEPFIIHTSYLGALLLDKVRRRWTCAEYSSQQGGILLCKVTNPILACFLLHCCKICFFTFLSSQVKYGLFFSRIPDGCIPVCSRAANVCGHDQHFHGAAPTHCAPATPHASVCQRASPEWVRDHGWQHAASHGPGGGGDAARHQSHGGETLSAVSCRGEEVRSVV